MLNYQRVCYPWVTAPKLLDFNDFNIRLPSLGRRSSSPDKAGNWTKNSAEEFLPVAAATAQRRSLKVPSNLLCLRIVMEP